MGKRSSTSPELAVADAALFVYLAAACEGNISPEALEKVAEEVGLSLSGRSLRRVPALSRRLSGLNSITAKSITGRRASPSLSALDLEESLVVARPTRRGTAVEGEISKVRGVLDIWTTESEGKLFIRVVHTTPTDRMRLESRLAEHLDIDEWQRVKRRLPSPESRTWREFAQSALGVRPSS